MSFATSAVNTANTIGRGVSRAATAMWPYIRRFLVWFGGRVKTYVEWSFSSGRRFIFFLVTWTFIVLYFQGTLYGKLLNAVGIAATAMIFIAMLWSMTGRSPFKWLKQTKDSKKS